MKQSAEEKEIRVCVTHLTETHSTNRYLHEWMARESLDEGCVVVADFQTAGKGQVGNHWESAAGQNLTFSLLLRPSFLPANRQFLVSQIVALAVKDTLDRYTEGIQIKWPNDIYWFDKKICGILIENDLAGSSIAASVIGIGLNINQTTFVSGAPNPVSLAQIVGHSLDREELLNAFIACFFDKYLALSLGEEASFRTAYMQALYHGEGHHDYVDSDGRFEARIYTIEPTGHLILQLRDGKLRRYAFKEVQTVIGS